MAKKSLFIVIEGLDGSGKTTASKLLTQTLQSAFSKGIKNSFEPHDASVGGLFIRQVLTKKITTFDPRVLALAFASNRLDHGARVIKPWLAKNEVDENPQILICDRYYLSSLVYQSSPNFGFEEVMRLNEKALQPDIIFFFNVSNEVCYARMAQRNLPQELFETKLSETRKKYLNAIDFLEKKGDNIIEIDASGAVVSVVQQMLDAIHEYESEWKVDTLKIGAEERKISPRNEVLLTNFLEEKGYQVGKQLPAMPFDTYELGYDLPLGLSQRGCAIWLNEAPRYDILMEMLPTTAFYAISDFMIVFTPNAEELRNDYFEREKAIFETGTKLSPSIQFVDQALLSD